MKNKAIISLILITVLALSTTIAFATSWSPTTGSGIGTTANPQDGWQILTGGFAGIINPSEGVWGTGTGYSNAAHAINVSSTGNFSLTITFKLQGTNTTAFVGLSTNSVPSNQAGWMVIGNTRNGTFRVSSTGSDVLGGRTLGNTTPALGTTYTAHIVSTDGGNTATFSVDGYGTPLSISLASSPKYIIIHLNNAGISPSMNTVPILTGVSFDSANPTVTVTPTPTATPTTHAAAALDLNAIREFYANQPATHMSDANAVRNADGSYSIPNGIGQVKLSVSGIVTSATGNTPIVGATVKLGSNTQVTGSNGGYKFSDVVPGKYNVTASANGYTATTKIVDATAANAVLNFALQSTAPAATPIPTATAVAATPVATATPTKTQSPGFGIVLVAMGMILAGAFITRKKK